MTIMLDITNISLGEIDQIELTHWIVNIKDEKVVAWINEIDINGDVVRGFEVTFWVTVPDTQEIFDYTDPEDPVSFDPPQYEPTPETWYVLASGNITELIGQSNEILAAIQGRLYP